MARRGRGRARRRHGGGPRRSPRRACEPTAVGGRSPHGPGSLGCPSRQVAAWWGWAAGRAARRGPSYRRGLKTWTGMAFPSAAVSRLQVAGVSHTGAARRAPGVNFSKTTARAGAAPRGVLGAGRGSRRGRSSRPGGRVAAPRAGAPRWPVVNWWRRKLGPGTTGSGWRRRKLGHDNTNS